MANKCFTFISAIIFCFKLQFNLCICIPFWLIRFIISMIQLKPELREMVSNNWYLNQNGSLSVGHNILLSMQVQSLVNIEHFTASFLQNCIEAKENGKYLFPEFQEKIVVWFGYPFWKKDETFDIKNHILSVNFDESTLNEETFFKFENNLLKEAFKNDSSPWKIYICQQDKSTRIIFCIHHVLGDGHSVYNTFMRIMDGQVAYDVPKNSIMTNLKNIFCHNPLILPIKFMEEFLKCQCFPPFNLNEETMSMDRYFVKSSRISKDKITNISKEQNVSFTTVLFCVITGAMRKYLVNNNAKIPDFIFCPMPIAFATSTRRLTNTVQAIGVALPLGEVNILDRLQACKKSLERAMKSEIPLFSQLYQFIGNSYPLAWKNLNMSLPSIMLTSFPGPTSPISTSEGVHMITDMHFNYYGVKKFCVIFTILTYNDGLRIVVSADPNAFKNEENVSSLMGLIEHEFHILHSINEKSKSI